jgi:F-type H+-transporting ATPase subunit b
MKESGMLIVSVLAATPSAEPSPVIPSVPDLIWGAFAFVVVLLFFVFVVVPRLQKNLDARRDAIEGGNERAEKAQAEANAALERYTAQLAEARDDAGRVREQARAEGAAILAEHRSKANEEAAAITADAQAQIESERKAALVSLRPEVGTMALGLASTMIGDDLSSDERAGAIVDRYLAGLDQDDASATK